MSDNAEKAAEKAEAKAAEDAEKAAAAEAKAVNEARAEAVAAPGPLSYQINVSGATDSGTPDVVRAAFAKLVRTLNAAGIPVNGTLSGSSSGTLFAGEVVPGEVIHEQAYEVIEKDAAAAAEGKAKSDAAKAAAADKG